MTKCKKGVTLIELLIAIAIGAIISEAIILVLDMGMTAWRFGDADISIQKVAYEISDIIIEGGYETDGLRNAREIYIGTPKSISFVCMREETIEVKYDMPENTSFTLTKQFKPGSQAPIVQVKGPKSSDYETTSPSFQYGEGEDPQSPDDKIIFTEQLYKGTKIKILYHPHSKADTSVLISFVWDPESKRLLRTCEGITEEIPTHTLGAKIENFKFEYYTSTNELIELEEGQLITQAQLKSVTAIGIAIKAKKADEEREVRSFISIRNIANRGVGVILAEGTTLFIPNSSEVKTLSLVNIHGVKDNDKIELEIDSPGERNWRLEVSLGYAEGAPEGSQPVIMGYSVYYSGKLVHSGGAMTSIESGVNLLGLGNEYYDYDDDERIEDKVNFAGENIKLTVKRMDTRGAALAVQP